MNPDIPNPEVSYQIQVKAGQKWLCAETFTEFHNAKAQLGLSRTLYQKQQWQLVKVEMLRTETVIKI